MGARTYRTFKQLLRASKTRKLTRGKKAKKTRRVKRRPFDNAGRSPAVLRALSSEAARASLAEPAKKQKGGAPQFSGESTVVGRPLDADEETPFTLESAANYTASLPT